MERINLFFAVDDNYCSFLSAALCSMFDNADKNFGYDIYVLHNGISEEKQQVLKNQVEGDGVINFVNMNEKLKTLEDRLVTRDYYTMTTYYRLFIPNMFPEMDKALYLDSDIIIKGDISKLYNVDMGNNLVGAVPDMAVKNTPVFIEYVEQGLGVKCDNYFNAGILLMNLKEMRAWNFEDKFIELLSKYKFRVAQDQDYLNVLTKNRVKYVDNSLNVQPVPGNICGIDEINLIHYNMLWKPWIFKDVVYEEDFWKYAKKSPLYNLILETTNSMTDNIRQNKLNGGAALLEMAGKEAKDPNNYYNKFVKKMLIKKHLVGELYE